MSVVKKIHCYCNSKSERFTLKDWTFTNDVSKLNQNMYILQELDMTSSDMCLIRDEPILSTMKQQGDVAKVKYCYKTRCDITVIYMLEIAKFHCIKYILVYCWFNDKRWYNKFNTFCCVFYSEFLANNFKYMAIVLHIHKCVWLNTFRNALNQIYNETCWKPYLCQILFM